MRFRDGGANGQNVASLSGTGTAEDTTHTDTLTAGDLFNLAMTDTGTTPTFKWVKANVEFASGHGCFHGAGVFGGFVCDVPATRRYLPINGIAAVDGTATIADVQWKNRGYTSIEAFQIRVSANARTNNSVFSVNVNGSDTGTTITFAAAATGLQTVTGMGISLSDGDLVCISMTLGTGVEDLTLQMVGVTLKSTDNASEVACGRQAGDTRAASATASYYVPGGSIGGVSATETDHRVKVGFAAVVKNLRCYLSANTYGADATLKLIVNGTAQITTTITASGGAGWYENTADTYNISDTDEISYEIVGGTSGSITVHSIGVTFGAPPAELAAGSGSYTLTGTVASTQFGRAVVAAAGSYALTGSDVTLSLGKLVSAEAGSYALSGADAALEFDRVIDAAAGSYTLTGADATLEFDLLIDAIAGAYTITGGVAALEFDRMLGADPGSYSLAGIEAALEIDRLLDAGAGSYLLSGSDAELSYGRSLIVESGSYFLTGAEAVLQYSGAGFVVLAESGTYVITGTDSDLEFGGGSAAFVDQPYFILTVGRLMN